MWYRLYAFFLMLFALSDFYVSGAQYQRSSGVGGNPVIDFFVPSLIFLVSLFSFVIPKRPWAWSYNLWVIAGGFLFFPFIYLFSQGFPFWSDAPALVAALQFFIDPFGIALSVASLLLFACWFNKEVKEYFVPKEPTVDKQTPEQI